MIRILKQGTLKKCTCDNCGSVLSYDEKDDVLEEVATTVDTGISSFSTAHFETKIEKYIICPQCDEKIVLWTRTPRGEDE